MTLWQTSDSSSSAWQIVSKAAMEVNVGTFYFTAKRLGEMEETQKQNHVSYVHE